MKLYEITGQMKQLDEFIPEIGSPEDAEAFSELYDGLSVSFDEKIDGICRIIKNIQAEQDAIENEEKRLRTRRQVILNKVQSLKNYTQHEMESLGLDKVKTELFTVAIQANPESVQVDESRLDDQWFKVKREPDKTKIEEALKAGEVIECAWLDRSKSLRIR